MARTSSLSGSSASNLNGSAIVATIRWKEDQKTAWGAVFPLNGVGGISTRRAQELAQDMGLSGLSKSTALRLCSDSDERVGEFQTRPLTSEWPYVWLDATYPNVRQGGRIVSVAAMIAVACNGKPGARKTPSVQAHPANGYREILGLGLSEPETFWTDFLRRLMARGADRTKPVILFGGNRICRTVLLSARLHSDLRAAIERVFDAAWPRCRVHWMRNAPAPVSRRPHSVVAALAIVLSPMAD